MEINVTLPKDQRIKIAAEKTFAKHGYEKATLDEIIALADVGKGTVYKYFGNKEQLFYRLVSEKNLPFVQRLRQKVEQAVGIDAKLLAFFKEMIAFYRENSVLWQIICFEMLGSSCGCMVRVENGRRKVVPRYGSEPAEEVKERILRYHALLESEFIILYNLLKEGIEDGSLKAGSPEIATKYLFFGVAMSIFHNVEEDRKMTVDEVAAITVDRFLYGEKDTKVTIK